MPDSIVPAETKHEKNQEKASKQALTKELKEWTFSSLLRVLRTWLNVLLCV